jgi:hypothetical protein
MFIVGSVVPGATYFHNLQQPEVDNTSSSQTTLQLVEKHLRHLVLQISPLVVEA